MKYEQCTRSFTILCSKAGCPYRLLRPSFKGWQIVKSRHLLAQEAWTNCRRNLQTCIEHVTWQVTPSPRRFWVNGLATCRRPQIAQRQVARDRSGIIESESTTGCNGDALKCLKIRSLEDSKFAGVRRETALFCTPELYSHCADRSLVLGFVLQLPSSLRDIHKWTIMTATHIYGHLKMSAAGFLLKRSLQNRRQRSEIHIILLHYE